MKLIASAFFVALSCSVALAGEIKFTTAPTVSKTNGSAKITFAVSGRTDVEVAILDSRGKAVRHLAAGVIGGKSKPPAPLTAGLSQSLKWDGRDDAGKKASGGPFKVRVGLGMQTKLGRIIGGDPYAIQQVCGIATDKNGHLYVLHKGYRKGDGPMYLQVYDSTGKYLRTILPAPPSMPYEKVAAFGAAKMPAGNWLFQNHWGRWPHLYPVGSGKSSTLILAPRATDDGRLMLHTATQVFYINTDGSAPAGGFKGIRMWKRGIRSRCGPLNVCPSPDGKWVYISGPCSGYIVGCGNSKPLPESPDGRVYRFPAKTGGADKFVDLAVSKERLAKHKSFVRWPSYVGGWSSAGGVAVDAEGNVLVCDRANDRIQVFSEAGKPVGALDVKDPWKVMVHPKTGELYVTVKEFPKRNRQPHKTEVVKYSGWKKGSRVLARLDLGRKAGVPFFAVDTSGKQSVLWIAGGGRLLRVVDTGSALTVAENLMERRKPGALPGADRMGIDRQRDEIYVNDAWAGLYRYNGLTGEGGKLKVTGCDIDVGADDNLYIIGGVGGERSYMGFHRYTRDCKPAPFPAWGGKHADKNAQYGRFGAGYSTKGLCVAPDGKTYMLDMYAWNKYWVTVYAPDGKFLGGPRAKGVNKTRPGGALIDNISNACGGVKVDRAGNIYIGMIGTPKDFQWPDGLKTRVNVALMGSIIKFGPKGGTVWGGKKAGPKPKKPGVQLYRDARPAHFMVGATKAFGGAAPCTVFGSCACRSPRFDLDEYGRLYVADVVTFKIRVYDAEGNLIRNIGSYGNPDTSGPESLVPKPELGFGWPISACVAERHLYVSDVVNRRVTRVDLGYATEALVPLAGGAASVTRPSARTAARKNSDDSDTSDLSDRSERPEKSEISRAAKLASARSTRSPKQVCTGWFSAARNYKRIGMKKDARRCLNNIVRTYPGTEWAARAKAELGEL
jgi:sugar lactone lactonase YvrE